MEPLHYPPALVLQAVTTYVDALLADYAWSTSSRAAVLQLAVAYACECPVGWECQFRAAWERATHQI